MKICPLCGKRIIQRNGEWANACLVDGVLTHKKCPIPKKKLPPEESKALKALRERITYQVTYHAKGYVKESGMNWMRVNRLIKELKNKGYSYDDQLIALDETVKIQGGFYGYGAVRNNIDKIIYRKRKKEEVMESSKPLELNHPKTEQFDLWTPEVDDFEW